MGLVSWPELWISDKSVILQMIEFSEILKEFLFQKLKNVKTVMVY